MPVFSTYREHADVDSIMLAQLRPSNTSPNVIYTKPVDALVIIDCIFACNTAGNTDIYIYHDPTNSGTYNQTTALVWDYRVSNDGFEIFQKFYMQPNEEGSTIAVEVDNSNRINFTIYGRVFD